ncbi:MAG: Gfo/Idh/MocA family oxidoreductase, partial [Pirellulaceae bacterium]|nr:Gfo/Idh/MocA family oxidoreductase [Pirellulaceae bacterium]
MNLTPEERANGRDNYYDAVGTSRRDFLKSVVGGGLATGVGLGAYYFGYAKVDNPVRVGVIGTGDEGNVLIGSITPEYLEVKSIADIRPSSIHRAFHGDWASPTAAAIRKGLMNVYDWKTEDEARKHVKVFTPENGGYQELLKDPDIEAVVIALPLHLHAKVAIEAMKAGKHVLTEKLMAHNVAQCKVMGQTANQLDLHLATGHQRHYSVLYDNAVNLIRWGLLGELHHIRAQWHRGNLPGRDSWQQPMPGGEPIAETPGKIRDRIAIELGRYQAAVKKEKDPKVA